MGKEFIKVEVTTIVYNGRRFVSVDDLLRMMVGFRRASCLTREAEEAVQSIMDAILAPKSCETGESHD